MRCITLTKQHLVSRYATRRSLLTSTSSTGTARTRTKALPSESVSPSSSQHCGSPKAEYVNDSKAPSNFLPNSALVYQNFISEQEAAALENDLLQRMRRKRFEKGHWDAVITDYKEVEIAVPSDGNGDAGFISNQKNPLSILSCDVIERVRDHIAQTHFCQKNEENVGSAIHWLPCHAIHLKKDGQLTAHVDSIKFSGGIVAGLSLMSPSIMRLRPASPTEISESEDSMKSTNESDESPPPTTIFTNNPSRIPVLDDPKDGPIEFGKSLINAGHVDLYLPPFSLYVLTGVSRYLYTHELLPSGSHFIYNDGSATGTSTSTTIQVDRDDRLSVIFRDAGH